MKLPQIDAALVKVTGVFSYNPLDIPKFISLGYDTILLSEEVVPDDCADPVSWLKDAEENTRRFYHDTYYSEFASLMFTGDSENHKITALKRSKTFELTTHTKNQSSNKDKLKSIKAIGVSQELFLFEHNRTGILALTFEPEVLDFYHLSDMIFWLRNFDASVYFEEQEMKFHEMISRELLGGLSLRGPKVLADRFSGSKFKIYSVINTIEPDNGDCYSRNHLVYEIGTCSRIGDMASNGINAPSQIYYEEIFKNSIQVFRNYTGLALVDSFTVIGQGVYKSKMTDFRSFNTYNRVYFAIYVFNLFMRYNVYRYNVVFAEDPIKTRDEFESFINKYNYSHISFNFLPNILYRKIHDALEIDVEVAHFEKRLVGLATRIQEDQQKRQATLLGIVSFVTGLSSFKDILDLLESGRAALGWPSVAFYFTLTLVFFLLAIPALTYLFPDLTKKDIRKFKKRRVVKNGHEV